MKMRRLAVLLSVVIALVLVVQSRAGRFPGGTGKADCYAEFEVQNVPDPSSPTAKSVECMDGTACDTDSTCGQCTLSVALCVNQTDPNVPKCTPMPPLTSLTSNIGALVNRTPLVGSACGAFAPVVVALKGKNHNKPKTFTMKVTAKSSGKPKKDVDQLKIKCTPNPSCVPSGSTTTTTIPTGVSCSANPAGGPNEVDLVVATSSTDLDNGWTGVSHNFPVVGNSTLKACLTTCGPDGTPPCQMSGVVGAGTPNGATFGAPLPLLAANVPVCVVNQWNGSPNGIGTIDPITGDSSYQINLTSKVYLTTATQVCPRCNNNKCDSGPQQGKPCTTDATLVVAQSLGANKSYNLSRDCPPDPGALAAPLDIRLPITTGTETKTGPKPCTAQPGEPTGVPVQDDNCGSSGCGSNNCTGSACASMGTDPSSGNPICIDSKGGLSQNCCNSDTTKACFPTAGGGSIVRTGKPSIPSPAFPDTTYPKVGNGVVVAIFCIPATGTNSIDSTTGLPGPGALVTPGTQTWTK